MDYYGLHTTRKQINVNKVLILSLARYRIGGSATRTAREREALMARNMMSNHTCSDRPVLTCKTSTVVTATIFTSFKTNTKETRKEVARPKAASPLLWWRRQAATLCILALNRVNVVAVTTILVLHVGVIGHHVPCH